MTCRSNLPWSYDLYQKLFTLMNSWFSLWLLALYRCRKIGRLYYCLLKNAIWLLFCKLITISKSQSGLFQNNFFLSTLLSVSSDFLEFRAVSITSTVSVTSSIKWRFFASFNPVILPVLYKFFQLVAISNCCPCLCFFPLSAHFWQFELAWHEKHSVYFVLTDRSWPNNCLFPKLFSSSKFPSLSL